MMENEDLKSIEKLIIHDIHQDLPGKLNTKYDYDISEDEIEKLCQLSSILSLSNESLDQATAYEIATKLFKNFYEIYPNLYSITHAILSRLGNFPNRDLLDKYGFNSLTLEQSPAIKLEVFAREIENRININENNSLLTDFQKSFFDILTKQKFYSISAPTSAGKSFIFVLSIIERFLKNRHEKIVLVVPTRALIRELSHKILKELKRYDLGDLVNVRTVPIIEDELDKKGVMYVLTQERLNTLLNEDILHLDTVFIDEAQEIQDNRGVILQNTLELLLDKFKDLNLFFASPLIKNPNYFNALLELKYDTNAFIEELSPVGQNIILLSSVKNKPKLANVNLLNDKKNLNLGVLELDFKFRNHGQIIDLALNITKEDELTLIYCNRPSDAENQALKTAARIKQEIDCEEVNSLIAFIKEDVHKDYSIIECLKKGVGYHYSKMPATVKNEIENLASLGKLQYVFCTSTLLQGVNLPTKNIIIKNPYKGSGKPMIRKDFLNLIGRAGRLKEEFQGNIWCIEPQDWEEQSYLGERLQNIEGYYDKTLSEKSDNILEFAVNNNNENIDMSSVFGKFYLDFIIGDKNIDKYKEIKSFENLNKVFEVCQNYKLDINNEIIRKHYSIHPKRLNELYDFFRNEKNLELWLPRKVFQTGTNERLKKIFKKIDEVFLKRENSQYTKFAVLASAWTHDNLLSEIIESNHSFNLKSEPGRKINTTIREVLEILESEIRFKYVVYSGAYLDILKEVISVRIPDYDLDTISNLPLHLECGSADPLVINLISLGLSRLTSIHLKKSRFFSCDEPTTTNCFNMLKQIDVKRLDIPLICKREILDLIV